MIVLGLHGGVTIGQHEPSAALCINGKIVAVCEEERYLRIKSCYGYLPRESINSCLKIAGIDFKDVDLVVTPGSTYNDFKSRWTSYLSHLYGTCPKIECINHQKAHISGSYFGSGVDNAVCLSLDATGDGLSGIVAEGNGKNLKIIEEIPNTNSLGFFYTLMTYYCGFSDGDEYKLMGLAPYGNPKYDLNDIIETNSDGWTLNKSYIRDNPPLKSPFEPMYSDKLVNLLKKPSRKFNQPINQFYKDIAASTQKQMEKCLISLIEKLSKLSTSKNLCYSGGVALNCSANRLLLENSSFMNIYVSPLSSDRGLSLGCAYIGAEMLGDEPQPINDVYLGKSYSQIEIFEELKNNDIKFRESEDITKDVAILLEKESIIGWFQGRSEAGARALGNRSIIASCSSSKMRDKVNSRIKFREEFRPFAPSILNEEFNNYFISNEQNINNFPYMTYALESKNEIRKLIPAVVHVDGTSRVQTISSSDNECYYNLIKEYNKITKIPVIMNTSFNLKGQPIVESPRDALMTFLVQA